MRSVAKPFAHRSIERSGSACLPGRLLMRLAAPIAVSAALLFLPAAPAASAADKIRIGLAAPFSGRTAHVGPAMADALRAAIEDANAEGGLQGQPLELVTADDACEGRTAQSSAAILVDRSAAVAIGHPCSGAAVNAIPSYKQAGVLLIAVGARHPDVTDANPAAAVLRLAGRDDRQGEAAARWLKAHAPGRRAAIVQDRTRYARAISEQAKKALERAGFEDVSLLSIVAGNRNYAKTVDAIRAGRAEAVLFAGFVEEAAILMDGLAEQRLEIPMLGTDSLATPAFAERVAASGRPVQVLMSAGPKPRENKPESGDDSQRALLAALARGAFEAWLTTVRRIGTTNAEATRRALVEKPVQTQTLGELRFDEHGDLAGYDFVPVAPRNGQWMRDD